MTVLEYDITKLIDKIDTAILLKARNIKKDGEADFKHLSIVDMKPFIKDKLAEISVKIFDKITSPVSRALTEERFEFDPLTEGETPAPSDKIIYRFNFPAKADSGIATAILRAIEDVMVSYAIYEWLYFGNYDYREEKKRYQESWDDLLSLITRRINLKRTYKLY